jgi:2,4-dienoyl-CoA reductase-like NADH-dependent reductase (Old Yellow Enzyme family)
LVHLGSRAVGGAALVIAEATGVSPEGRISPGDLGLYNDEQLKAFRRITKFIEENGAVPGIQLAHAGRKASVATSWDGGKPLGPGDRWTTLAPSAIPFEDGWPAPKEMTDDDLETVADQFAKATERAVEAGFKVVEVHAAHGYLLHEFLSPLSNHRTDDYGGSLENRMRFPLDVVKRVRNAFPQNLPMFVRISASDWTGGGWDLESSIAFARKLREIGCDLVDCSSGGNVPHAKIPVEPGYQVRFAEGIRKHANIPTGAVGLITDAHQAEDILKNGQADAILIARELLRDPYFPLHAAHALGESVAWPKQYDRAAPRGPR